MFGTLKLLLPALIPSWRFFDVIAPSPRIEFVLLKTQDQPPEHWQEFRPRPQHLGFGTILKRMVWNPQWNESLFLISCAERLLENPTDHSRKEILNRIRAELVRHSMAKEAISYLQFRLVLLEREELQLLRSVAFLSPVYPYTETAKI